MLQRNLRNSGYEGREVYSAEVGKDPNPQKSQLWSTFDIEMREITGIYNMS
jgi:hypothetical protein